jgi:DUF3040 family protein
VEVVVVLDPQDKKAFDGMVARIHAEDPQFVQRIERLRAPRRRFRMTMAILLWTVAPFCIFLGGWTGLIMAVVAVGYGVRLITKRSGMTGGPSQFSWWSSGKRPGASL